MASTISVSKAVAPRFNLLSIDALRGLAALWVMAYHAFGFFWRGTDHFPAIDLSSLHGCVNTLLVLTIGQGWIGVPLFFVLSGFCIHLPYTRRTTLDLNEFGIRRLLRIWPPYMVAALLGMAMAVVSTHRVDLTNLVGHGIFWIWSTQPLGKDDMAFNGVVWSVVAEVHLYILYALCWRIMRNFGLVRMTLLFLVFGIAYHVAGEVYQRGHSDMPNLLSPRAFALARFGEWLLGACVAESLYLSTIKSSASRRIAVVPLVIAGLAIVGGARLIGIQLGCNQYTPETFFSLGFALVVAALAFGEQHRADGKQAGSLVRLFGAIGVRGYSLYLFHFPIIVIVGELAARKMGLSTEGKDALRGTTRWLLVTLSALPLVAIATELSYRFMEMPSHKLARSWAERIRTMPAKPVEVPTMQPMPAWSAAAA